MAALAWLTLAGCSPVSFALREGEAERALHSAESTDARQRARYELTLARLYLAKAREAASEAHYALALALAERSTDSAVRARTLAVVRARAEPRASTARGADAE